MLKRDTFLVLPEQQIQQIPGMTDDMTTFDIFPQSIRLKRDFKKDIQRALQKRVQYSISNIKLPEMKSDFEKFKPLKNREAFDNSESLNFNPAETYAESLYKQEEKKVDRNLELKNIRDFLLRTGIKMRGVSIEIIDAVQRFENTNVFSIEKNLERMIEE